MVPVRKVRKSNGTVPSVAAPVDQSMGLAIAVLLIVASTLATASSNVIIRAE